MATKGFSSVVARCVAGEGRLGFFGVKGFRGLTRCFLALAVVGLMAQGAWAQNAIDVGADQSQFNTSVGNANREPINCSAGSLIAGTSTFCQMNEDGDLITICGGTRYLTGATSSRVILIKNGTGNCTVATNLVLDGVSVYSANRPAISIPSGSTGTVTLNILNGTNNVFQAAGDTAAGIYVPGTIGTTAASNLVIKDTAMATRRVSGNLTIAQVQAFDAGSLLARGAGAYGFKHNQACKDALMYKLLGGGAGIGASGSYQLTTNTVSATTHRPATPSFGNITIRGGKITAIGGANGVDPNGGFEAYGGAGIGGGGNIVGCVATEATTATGNGTISIQGGTTIVQGGDAGANGIGAGGNSATNIGTLTITGGSLTARTAAGALQTGNTGMRTTITDSRARYELEFGSSPWSRTADKRITACALGNTANAITCTSNTTGITASQYGVNSVYTDASGKVYFWLASEQNSGYAGNTVHLANVPDVATGVPSTTPTLFNWSSGTGVNTNVRQFRSGFVPPEMSVPSVTPGTLVGDATDTWADNGITGPYKTTFRNNIYQQVAAVGHAIKVYAGTYKANENGNANYNIRWFKSSTILNGVPIGRVSIQNTTTAGCGNTTAFGGISNVMCATYTPQANDFGQYIWAEVKVRGASQNASDGTTDADWTTATNVSALGTYKDITVYPPIHVGVVTKIEVVSGGDAEVTKELNICTTTPADCKLNTSVAQFGGSRADGLYMPEFPLSLSASIIGMNNLTATWSASYGSTINVSSYFNSNQANPAIYNLDELPSISGDLIFTVDLKDGSVSELDRIKICKGTTTCEEEVIHVRVVNRNSRKDMERLGDMYELDDDGNGGFKDGLPLFSLNQVGSDGPLYPLPKQGRIELYFDAQINASLTNMTVSMETGSSTKDLTKLTEGVTQTVTYSYSDLTPGETYNFNISGFVNAKANPATPFSSRVIVEQKATVDFEYASTMKFIVGENVTLNEGFKYNGHQSDTQADLCYYLQYGAADASGNAPGASADTVSFPSVGTTCINTGTNISTPPSLVAAQFGNYVRLVARPTGSFNVDGTTEGEIKRGAWKRIGVLLVPAADVSNSYTRVAFKGCDAQSPDPVGITGCQQDGTGLIVYDKNPVRLGVNLIETVDGKYTQKKVKNWEASGTGITNQNCPDVPSASANFDCGKYPTYAITTVPSDGKITITPTIDDVEAPKITKLTLGTLRTSGINLDSDGSFILKNDNTVIDGDSIKILNTQLKITFDMAIDRTSGNLGTIELVRTGDAQSLSGLMCDDVSTLDSKTCTVTLHSGVAQFTTSAFERSPFALGSAFEKNFKIVVANFRDIHGEKMDTEQFFFTTAAGPSVDAPTLTSVVPNHSEKFAVTYPITGTIPSGSYKANGGGVEAATPTHKYRWQRAANTNAEIDTAAAHAISTLATYTPTKDDFGKQIRLIVIPEDVAQRKGKPVASAWAHVGALVTLTGEGVTGHSYTPRIGSSTVAPTSTLLTPTLSEVVYDASTSIGITSSDPSDLFDTWAITGNGHGATIVGTNPASLNIANPTLATIAITGKMKDGVLPTISAAQYGVDAQHTNGLGIVLTINKPGMTAQTGTIKINNTTYNLPGTISPVCDGSQCTLTLPYTAFSGLAIGTNNEEYVVSVSAGAFKDAAGNFTAARTNLLTFYGGSSSYAANLSVSGLSRNDKVYGDDKVKFVDADDNEVELVVKNNSTAQVIFDVSLKGAAASDFVITADDGTTNLKTVTSGVIAAQSANGEYRFKVRLAAADKSVKFTDGNIDAYKDVLQVTGYPVVSGGKGTPARISGIEIDLSYTIKPKLITVSADATFENDNKKVYDGNKTAPPVDISSFNWSGDEGSDKCVTASSLTPQTSCAGIYVLVTPGEYANEFIGTKNVEIKYEIKGGKDSNYTFSTARISQLSRFNITTITGTITPRPVNVVFASASDSLGEKYYDGTNNWAVGNRLVLEAATAGTGIVVGDNVSLNTEAAAFTLSGTNVGANSISGVSGLTLTGDKAGNYSLTNSINFNQENKTVTIKAVSLADYLGSTTTNVTAKATYGSSLTASQSWTESPTNTAANDKLNSLGGTWKVCTDIAIEACSGKNLASQKEWIELPKPDYYVYFDATSPNFIKDFAVPLHLTVDPMPITINPNLVNAGGTNANGIKVYDGLETISGVSPLSIAQDISKYDDWEKVIADIVVNGTAEFPDKNAGANKPLTVMWKWSSTTTGECTASTCYDKKYSLLQTNTLGTITPKPLFISGVKVNSKSYDNTTTATYPVGAFDAKVINEGQVVKSDSANGTIDPIKLTINTTKINENNATPRFIDRNVNWNSNANDGKGQVEPVDVVFTIGDRTDMLNGNSANNYTLEIETVKTAKIEQIELPVVFVVEGDTIKYCDSLDAYNKASCEAATDTNTARTKNLKSEGTYGSNLGDIYINAVWPAPAGGFEKAFPRQLVGIGGENIPGLWTWKMNENGADPGLGGATALSTTCDSANYATHRNAMFESQSYNYKPRTIPVSLCVKPYQLIVGPPVIAGNGMKTYDATRTYTHEVSTGSGWQDLNKGINLEGLVVKPAASYENYTASQSSNDYRPLTVTYTLEGNTHSPPNFLKPVDFVYPAGFINKRPITVYGIVPQNKYYDGLETATVLLQGGDTIRFSYPKDTMYMAKDTAGKPDTNIIAIEGGVMEADIGKFSLKHPEPGMNNTLFHFPTYQASEPLKDSDGNPDDYLPRRVALRADVGTPFGIVSENEYSKNYNFEMPPLEAIIWKASFVKYMCGQLEDTWKDLKDSLNKEVEHENALIEGDCSETTLIQMLVNSKHADGAVEAYYGDRFSVFADKLNSVLPTTMRELFGVNNDDFVSWSWIPGHEPGQHGYQIKEVNAIFTGYAQVAHGSGNYEDLKAGIRVPVRSHPRRLEALNVRIKDREYRDGDSAYNKTTLVESTAKFGNLADFDESYFDQMEPLITRATMANANAGTSKPVKVEFLWQQVPSIVLDYESKYIKPDDIQPSQDLTVTINTSLCEAPINSKPDPEVPLIYWDRSSADPSLSASLDEKIKFKYPSFWSWLNPSQTLSNPADKNIDWERVSYSAQYMADTCDYTNYHADVKETIITILRRSSDASITSAAAKAEADVCGSSTARVTVITNDMNAIVKDANNEVRAGGTFAWPGTKYGTHSISYGVQAQDYDEPQVQYDVLYNRLLPFNKVVYEVRAKTWTVALDTTQRDEIEYFRDNPIDPLKTQWYNGNTLVATGRNLTKPSDPTQVWVRLFNSNGGYITSSCHEGGDTPALMPIAKPGVTIVASSFSSKVVAGGTTLTLNTPNGGSVKIYTMKGELISAMNAIENRTVVRIPNTQGMYIVKLEAK